MRISVDIGRNTFGGYPWRQYTIELAPSDDGQDVSIVFRNKRGDEPVMFSGRSYARETTYSGGRVLLPRKAAKWLYQLLGEFLLHEGPPETAGQGPVEIDES